MNLYPFSRFLSVAAFATSFASGCVDTTDPLATGAAAITASQLDDDLDALGDTRLEITVAADGGSAREIEVYPASWLVDEEYVESLVRSVDAQNGTLTLALGDLVVSVAEGARFRTEEDSNVGASSWYELVEAALGAGEPVFVRVIRPAPATPQAPDDPTFVASEVRLDDVDEAKLEINVDGDNLEASGDSGTLVVLGVELAVTKSTWIHTSSGSSDDSSTTSSSSSSSSSGSGGGSDDDPDSEDHGPDHT